MILKNFRFQFFPELSHFLEDSIYVTTNNVWGTAWKLPNVDLESKDLDHVLHALENILKTISPKITFKIKSVFVQDFNMQHTSFRSDAIQDIGFINRSTIFLFERSGGKPLWKTFKQDSKIDCARFKQDIPTHLLNELGAVPLNTSEVENLFLLSAQKKPCAAIIRQKDHLDFATHVTGVVRIWRQLPMQMNQHDLATISCDLRPPFEICTSFKKLDKIQSDFLLRSALSRNQNIHSAETQERGAQIEQMLTNFVNTGLDIFNTEWLLILKRTSEEVLRNDLKHTLDVMNRIGDAMIENYGVSQSFKAALAGSPQHFTFLEGSQNIVKWFPHVCFGQKSPVLESKRGFLMHRLDGSLFDFDLFNPKYTAYNTIITGKTGSGKSVFANLLTSCLLNDPDITIAKIDVGGSASKECALFGGTEIKFDLSVPSGLNPFAHVSDHISNDAISILVEFLAVLIREENESVVPKQMRADIERAVKALAEQNKALTIDGLIEMTDFPRSNLLGRWSSIGIFANAFQSKAALDNHPKYTYFNFLNIQSASNRDFLDGIMASVVAKINLDMLSLQNTSKRLVLMCDETKFFIERNANFFLLTTANFRKFGHAVILIGQNVSDFELTLENGKKDIGIILNSPTRVFFSAQGNESFLKEQFALDDKYLKKICHPEPIVHDYRDAVVQDEMGTRIVRLFLSKKEYWQYTSSFEARLKLDRLLANVPGLTMEEAIACLKSFG
jgi:hypothetical protein